MTTAILFDPIAIGKRSAKTFHSKGGDQAIDRLSLGGCAWLTIARILIGWRFSRTMSLAEYHRGLSTWVREQRERLGEDGIPLSHGRLAIRIAIDSGKEFDPETLRKWEVDWQKLKRRIAPESEEAIASYCRTTNQPIPEWLQSRVADASVIDPIEYIRQAGPSQAQEIAQIAAECVRWLIAHGFGPRVPPASIEAFRAELYRHGAIIAQATKMPPERIKAIAQGAFPTQRETMALAEYWGPDTDWLADLINQAKAESAREPTTDRPAKSKRHRLPGGKA